MRSEPQSFSHVYVEEKELDGTNEHLGSELLFAGPSAEQFEIAGNGGVALIDAKLAASNSKSLNGVPKFLNIIRAARRTLRRAFDVVCALAGLVILAPLLAIVAAAIKWEDGGPVLFSQPRVGKGLAKFRLFKFRSMVPNTGGNSFLTAPDDPRVTRVGRILRKYKLDELPQLANIVRGEMQLVGVRPQVECFVDIFPVEYFLLLQDRPGITDLATLTYRNEERMFQAGSLEKQYVSRMLPQKLRLALEYRRTRTFLSDLEILIRTVLGFKSPAAHFDLLSNPSKR